MKPFKSLFLLFTLAIPTVLVSPANGSEIFQGVTFTFVQTDPSTLMFQIQNADSATGDWSRAQFLGAFDLKDLGENLNTATATLNGPGATNVTGSNSQLSASNVDCTGGGSPRGSICFNLSPDAMLTADMLYTIDFSSPLSIAAMGPHLQIAFTRTAGGAKVGSLYSENVAPASRGSSGSPGGGTNSEDSVSSSSGGTSGDGVVSSSADAPLPEPGTLALVTVAALALATLRRRRWFGESSAGTV